MLHSQISFYGNPATLAGIQLRDGRPGGAKMCILCILCVVLVIDAALLPLPFLPSDPPPDPPTPLCVDVQKKRIVFQVTLSNHPPLVHASALQPR